MLIYPAIDIKNGKAVMLTQGKFDKETIYYEKPQEVAKMWEEKGAQILHIVDLDGAMEGESRNLPVIEAIVKAVNIPIQLGGGIRSLEAIDKLLAIGVDRVILGTKAIEDRDLLKQALADYGDKIVVAIDGKDGYVAVRGWTETSKTAVLDFAKRVEALGVKTMVYTDIGHDGMLKGPNFEGIKKMKDNLSMNIIASGGVSSREDVEKLIEIGVEGAIIGKALYEGKIDLLDLRVDKNEN